MGGVGERLESEETFGNYVTFCSIFSQLSVLKIQIFSISFSQTEKYDQIPEY